MLNENTNNTLKYNYSHIYNNINRNSNVLKIRKYKLIKNTNTQIVVLKINKKTIKF